MKTRSPIGTVYAVLDYLTKAQHPPTLSTISNEVRLSYGRTIEIIEPLVIHDLVKKERDYQTYHISLTSEGRNFLLYLQGVLDMFRTLGLRT